MKNFLLFCLFLLVQISAFAIPPRPDAFTVRQADGSEITVYRCGNERFSYYTTIDGLILQRGADRSLYYAEMKDGKLIATKQLAHNPEERKAPELKLIKQLSTTSQQVDILLSKPEHRTKMIGNDKDGLGEWGVSGYGSVSSVGKHTIPVILVSYADVEMGDTVTIEKVTRQLNEKGYHDEPHTNGSARDYFLAMSQGLFDPTFEVVAKVKVSRGYAYYGKNSNGRNDVHVLDLVKEACDLAAEQGVDFRKYVEADKGCVPLVSIMYAGPGEANSTDEHADDYIWPHQWTGINYMYSGYTIGNQGVKVGAYFVGNELNEYKKGGVKKKRLAGINIFVHEFGHALGLPDGYYTGSNPAVRKRLKTMGLWDHMDIGCYLNNAATPVAFTSYERSYLGWLKLEELKEERTYALQPFDIEGRDNTAYIIRNPKNENEYYLFENRQANPYHLKEMGTGMLVLHIDYDAQAWATNVVNNIENHPRMAYVPADGVRQQYYDYDPQGKKDWTPFVNDLYPNADNNTLSISSHPAMRVFTGGTLNKPLYNIRRQGNLIVFDFLKEQGTGIADVTSEPAEKVLGIYDLQGRRIDDNNQPGVYILKTDKGSRRIIRK